MKKLILVTGGLGYIGSHVTVQLYEAGYEPVIFDNLSNSSLSRSLQINKLTGKSISLEVGDIRIQSNLDDLFAKYKFHGCIHLAGLKSVDESIRNPQYYYDVNVLGSIKLIDSLIKNNVNNFIFSSSATVYGDQELQPVTEYHACNPMSPYGMTKLVVENYLAYVHNSNKEFNYAALRYFNPVGAHPTGLIGEMPKGTPANLMPYLLEVASGQREKLSIYGDDYPTKDGTGIRDYIHVVDLSDAHISVLNNIEMLDTNRIFNVGTGIGTSVLEIVTTFIESTGVDVPYCIASRRDGDIAVSFASPDLIMRTVGWSSRKSLMQMCVDAWKWQSNKDYN